MLRAILAAVLSTSVFAGHAQAQEAKKAEKPEKASIAADRVLVQGVLDKLLAEMERPDGFDAWPPKLRIDETDVVNAFAGLDNDEFAKGRNIPVVIVNTGFLTFFDRRPERMAWVLGHELGHLGKRHAFRTMAADKDFKTAGKDFVKLIYSRDFELEADEFGVALALKAGYKHEDLSKALSLWYESHAAGAKPRNSSPEGLSASHPQWQDRAARIDKNNAALWRSFSAFNTGVFFLDTEHYANAARCFREAVRQFEMCYEAHANLGFALLMDYCDRLDSKDLQSFELGHLVVGGFYRRPGSLETLLPREQYPKIWTEAVASLEQALKLKPGLRFAEANLGIAYLVRPTALGGKDPVKALAHIEASLNGETSAVLRAGLLCNKAAAELAAGKKEAAVMTLGLVAAALNGLDDAGTVSHAAMYNQALILGAAKEKEDHVKAARLLESYLGSAAPSQVWWSLAKDRYRKLCEELKLPVKADADFRRPQPKFRTAASVTTALGAVVGLAEPREKLEGLLGKPAAVNLAIPGTRTHRFHYPDHGVVLLVDAEGVVSVIIKGEKAPPLTLQSTGLGGKAIVLKIGMSKDDLETILGEPEVFMALGVEDEVAPRFYPKLGVGARIVGGKVRELFIAPPPRAG